MPTLKESPADASVVSHVYMVRGGFIRRLAAGIYNFLPLGYRVVRKIEEIVRQEMDRAGAQEVLMPAATPAELWQETGRWDKYGAELLRFQDRKGADFCYGPTHEEVIVDMVRRDVSSYRDLPVNLYQIQGKFRDELRPRAGLMRGREFIMKDAYSFDVSAEAAQQSYDVMYETYGRIFSRCGLDFRPVEADTGSIGGSRSHEFQVLADSGEDAIVACDTCDYAANIEQAETQAAKVSGSQDAQDKQLVETPGVKSIEEACKFLKVEPTQTIKTLVYLADDEPVAVAVRGDRSVNEVALKKALGASTLFLAREGQVKKATGVMPGSVGPVDSKIRVVADRELAGMVNAACGANQSEAHLTGVSVARDIPKLEVFSLRAVQEGDLCPRCDGTLKSFRGIEVGHVFFLGTAYSEPMNCVYLDEGGKQVPMVMGCYGIGITRIAAAAIEQNHDEGGICWPMSIAPYQVAVLPLQMKVEAVVSAGDKLYQELQEQGIEVVLDDRNERPGSKFKDADLVGYPIRIAIGKRSLAEGKVEVKWRTESEPSLVPIDGVAASVAQHIRDKFSELTRKADDFS